MSLVSELDLLSARGTNSLSHLIKIAGIKAKSPRKADMVKALDAYLSNKQNIVKIFNELHPMEKELLEEIIRGQGNIEIYDVKTILSKYNKPVRGKYYYLTDLFEENSSVRLFIFTNDIPRSIFNELKKHVKPPEKKFTIQKESALDKDKELRKIIIGESFEKDCINYIKLANKAKLRVTKGSGLPTKAAMIKIDEALINKELLIDADSLDDYRVIEQTYRLYGLSRLLLNEYILVVKDGLIQPGPDIYDFLKMSVVDKCRMLFEDYLHADDINELDRIREHKIKTDDDQPDLSPARKTVMKHLAEFPVNEWIDVVEMSRFIKKSDRGFLVEQVGGIAIYNSYDRYYYSGHGWLEVEGRFIQVMLLEYLSAMGMVDVLVKEDWDDYGNIYFLTVGYFRLTPLGAFILGVNDSYKEQVAAPEASGIMVQPNYEVVVNAGDMQEVHILFLDKFAEKVSEGAVNVYRLSFKAIVNALDEGISVQEIIDYFQEFSVNPIPENVLLTLQDWERESKRVRIRTVTILETDDQYLLEELKSYKSVRKHIKKDLPYAIEIDNKGANKLKREVEKKNRFCRLISE